MNRFLGAAAALIVAGYGAGCGYVGDPLPPLANLGLTPNADVRRVEHPMHAAAESGLNVIARALRGEPTFKAAALRALYPPPAPAEPKLSTPGFALASAISSWIDFAGTLRLTTRTSGVVLISVIGSKSLAGS